MVSQEFAGIVREQNELLKEYLAKRCFSAEDLILSLMCSAQFEGDNSLLEINDGLMNIFPYHNPKYRKWWPSDVAYSAFSGISIGVNLADNLPVDTSEICSNMVERLRQARHPFSGSDRTMQFVQLGLDTASEVRLTKNDILLTKESSRLGLEELVLSGFGFAISACFQVYQTKKS